MRPVRYHTRRDRVGCWTGVTGRELNPLFWAAYARFGSKRELPSSLMSGSAGCGHGPFKTWVVKTWVVKTWVAFAAYWMNSRHASSGQMS